jgi:hypothetical protein
MLKGNVGGQFSSQQIRTIDQDIEYPNTEVGPSQDDFTQQVQSTQLTSKMNPQSNEFYPSIPQDTRVRHSLGMNPDIKNPSSPPSWNLSLPYYKDFKKQWETNKAVNISNLFPEFAAREIHDYYFNQPDDWWDLILYPDLYFDYTQSEIDNPGYYHMYRTQEGDPSIPERLAHIHKLNNDGVFSYTYRRTRDLKTQLHPYLEIFQTPKFREYLSLITGYENLVYDENHTFISNYSSGHFNGPHTDGANGRIAFVFHLSKDWLPQYGGLFMRMDWDWKTVNKVIVPPFNTLSIFDTKWQDKPGAPHLVSEVVQGVDNKRISYTGWYL